MGPLPVTQEPNRPPHPSRSGIPWLSCVHRDGPSATRRHRRRGSDSVDRGSPAVTVGGGEQEPHTARGGAEPGPTDPAGRDVKRALSPDRLRIAVKEVEMACEVSQRRACRVLRFPRATHRCRCVHGDRTELRLGGFDLEHGLEDHSTPLGSPAAWSLPVVTSERSEHIFSV